MLAGLQVVQAEEALASLILSWKEDLDTVVKIKDNGCMGRLEEIAALPPSAHQFAVAAYCCMATEILLRDISNEKSSATALSDAKQLGTFMTNVLKITKASIPKHVTSAVDKFVKDKGGKEIHS